MFMSVLSIQLIKFKLSPRRCLEKFLNYILALLIYFYLEHDLDSGYLENPNICGYMCCRNILKQVILLGAEIKKNFKVKKLQIYKEYLLSNRWHQAGCYLGHPDIYNGKHFRNKPKGKMNTLKIIQKLSN